MCDPQTLLSLRAVCRGFRDQLNVSRQWLPPTMALPCMRYDERLAGWAGMEAAMRREACTFANCDTGRFTRGPALRLADMLSSAAITWLVGSSSLSARACICSTSTLERKWRAVKRKTLSPVSAW